MQDTEPAVPDGATALTRSKQFVFSGDLQSVPDSRELVMDYIRRHCSDDPDEIDLMIAVQEALANAALHGCKDDAGKTIQCSVEIQGPNVCIAVRDPGPGFDFKRVADPKRFGPSKLEHGRGIALMRGLVDEVTFASGGSEVRLKKRMNCHASPAASDT